MFLFLSHHYMGGSLISFPNSKQYPQNTFEKFRRLHNNNLHTILLSYLRIHAQPQPMSRNATRNRSAPTGKIADMRIPHPNARAHSPRKRHQPQCIQFAPFFPLTYSSIYTACRFRAHRQKCCTVEYIHPSWNKRQRKRDCYSCSQTGHGFLSFSSPVRPAHSMRADFSAHHAGAYNCCDGSC